MKSRENLQWNCYERRIGDIFAVANKLNFIANCSLLAPPALLIIPVRIMLLLFLVNIYLKF